MPSLPNCAIGGGHRRQRVHRHPGAPLGAGAGGLDLSLPLCSQLVRSEDRDYSDNVRPNQARITSLCSSVTFMSLMYAYAQRESSSVPHHHATTRSAPNNPILTYPPDRNVSALTTSKPRLLATGAMTSLKKHQQRCWWAGRLDRNPACATTPTTCRTEGSEDDNNGGTWKTLRQEPSKKEGRDPQRHHPLSNTQLPVVILPFGRRLGARPPTHPPPLTRTADSWCTTWSTLGDGPPCSEPLLTRGRTSGDVGNAWAGACRCFTGSPAYRGRRCARRRR